jgi:hypothetical protein
LRDSVGSAVGRWCEWVVWAKRPILGVWSWSAEVKFCIIVDHLLVVGGSLHVRSGVNFFLEFAFRDQARVLAA